MAMFLPKNPRQAGTAMKIRALRCVTHRVGDSVTAGLITGRITMLPLQKNVHDITH